MFWKTMTIWGLALISLIVARPYFQPSLREVAAPRMPTVGDTLTLPDSVRTIAGDTIPTLAATRKTMFLINWAACEPCKRGLPSYPELLSSARRHAFETRVVVIAATKSENDWFLDRLPGGFPVILDSTGFGRRALRVGTTPSVLILGKDAVVEAAFSPFRDWPVTEDLLATFSSGPPEGDPQPTGG